MNRLLLLNGPNLNLLGTREPQIYGSEPLAAIERRCALIAREHGCELTCFQSNAEHELIARIHGAAAEGVALLIFNPGAFTHTSIALRDAVLATGLPMIELHLSNPQAREEFRRRSYFADIAVGLICGFGPFGYELAAHAACRHIKSSMAVRVQPGLPRST
jgi:3-dehydroquinate dehydratase-2